MRLEAGQSLVEVVIASMVGILVVSALTFATIFSLRNANFAKTSAQATKLAQEGLELVRTGRDKGGSINNSSMPNCLNVCSWNGNPAVACNSYPLDEGMWNCQITGSGLCNNTDGGQCYFNVDSAGALTNIGSDWIQPEFPSLAQDPVGDGKFKRVVILSDDPSSYKTQKTVTAIVRWSDAAGKHDSKLMTILRKL